MNDLIRRGCSDSDLRTAIAAHPEAVNLVNPDDGQTPVALVAAVGL